jgi:hypothetical protein
MKNEKSANKILFIAVFIAGLFAGYTLGLVQQLIWHETKAKEFSNYAR